MPNIPLYERQVTPTTEIAGAMASPEAAAAPWQAVAQLGGQVADIGFEYAARKKELKEKADISDYEVRRRNFETGLIQKKNDAMMGGMPYQDVYDEIVVPEIAQFDSDIGARGYSKASEGAIRELWALDSYGIARREIQEREKMELEDYTLRRQQEAELRLGDGDAEGAETIYGELEGTVGAGRVAQMRSSALYGMFDQEMIDEERIWLETRDDDAYFNALEDIKSRADASQMLGGAKSQVSRVAGAKANNFMKKRVNAFEKAKNKFIEISIAGDVTTQDYEELRREAGPAYADAMEAAALANLEAKAVYDPDAKEAIGWLNKFREGDSNWPEVLRKTQNYSNGIGELSVINAGNMAVDLSRTQNAIVGYESVYRNKKFAVGGYTSDFIGRINEYANLMEDGQASFVNDKLKAIANWQKINPDPSEDDYNAFVSEQFKKVASLEVQKMVAPQQPEVLETPSITTQEGYDALPAGSRYIHPDGSTRIKK